MSSEVANVEVLGNDVLDAVLTSTLWQDRPLSTNTEATLPLNAMWIATGNNVVLRGDLLRRVCPIYLVAKRERPEERSNFRYPDLIRHVTENRSELIRCVLTILRRWYATGCPRADLSSWGSYEGWSGVVRQALVHAGLFDPILHRSHLLERDDERMQHELLARASNVLDPEGRGITDKDFLVGLQGNDDFAPHLEAMKEL